MPSTSATTRARDSEARARRPWRGRQTAAEVNPADLADNTNYDGEWRLLYVALAQADRYLLVASSGPQEAGNRVATRHPALTANR